MPARKIKASYMTSTGYVASTKSKGAAAFESTLERDFLTLLEFSPEVESFEVQPVTISWVDTAGKSRKYTPDVLVVFDPESARTPMLVEVKYHSELQEKWPDLRSKYEAAHEFAAAQGWVFRLVTDRHIRSAYGKNASFLLPYVNRGLNHPEHWPILEKAIFKTGPIRINDLLDSLYEEPIDQAFLIPSLWFLIGTFRIGLDLNQRLNMDCEVWTVPGLSRIDSVLARYNILVREVSFESMVGSGEWPSI